MPGAFNPKHSPKFFISPLPEITNTPSRDKFHFTFGNYIQVYTGTMFGNTNVVLLFEIKIGVIA